jgi:hypothetical protein
MQVWGARGVDTNAVLEGAVAMLASGLVLPEDEIMLRFSGSPTRSGAVALGMPSNPRLYGRPRV